MPLPEMIAIGRSADSPRRNSAAAMRFTWSSTCGIAELAPAIVGVALRRGYTRSGAAFAHFSSGSLSVL